MLELVPRQAAELVPELAGETVLVPELDLQLVKGRVLQLAKGQVLQLANGLVTALVRDWATDGAGEGLERRDTIEDTKYVEGRKEELVMIEEKVVLVVVAVLVKVGIEVVGEEVMDEDDKEGRNTEEFISESLSKSLPSLITPRVSGADFLAASLAAAAVILSMGILAAM